MVSHDGPHIFMDFETRSKVDLGDHGLFRYAADSSTLPLMLAYGNAQGVDQWSLMLPHSPETKPPCPERLVALIEDPETVFHAHNAGFEIAIWDLICVKRWGWPAIARNRWHCTAARAAAANQPRSLDKVTQRLGSKEKKDSRGKALIKLLSCPTKAQVAYTKPRKDDIGDTIKDGDGRTIKDVNKLSARYAKEQGWPLFDGPYEGASYFFNEDPDLMDEFRRYNLQDIRAEWDAHDRLPDPHAVERQTWLLDLAVNWRGIPVDLALCHGAVEIHRQAIDWANSRLEVLTDGAVTAVTQRQRIVNWINKQCNFGESLTQDDVAGALESEYIPKHVKEVLELRQLAGGTAVSKYKAAIMQANHDGRVRGQLLYYGATTTGRWAGRGIQPHNFKREKTLDDGFIRSVKRGDLEGLRLVGDMSGKSVFEVLKGCLRGMICAPEGKVLLFSDFAGVESRGLNWLVGNDVKTDLFRRGQDAYIHTALDVYKVKYEEIADWSEEKGKWVIKPDHADKRQIGKACELGLGYGMGHKTFKANAERAGSVISMEFAKEVVDTWREANHQIPEFWKRIEAACWHVTKHKNPKVRATVDMLDVYYDPRDYLCIRLPSGRVLHYFKPRIMKDKRPDAAFDWEGNPCDPPWRIFYLDGGKAGFAGNLGMIDTYGGKLCENIIQALCRDMLVHSMLIIQREGVPIVFHVHDEVVTEIDENDSSSFDIVHQAMETVPPWAEGFPLEAETQISRRFTK